jgi:anti-anti-sigma factor
VPLLNVALVPAPDQVVVRLTGDADLSTSGLIADALLQAAGLGTRQVVVDVAGVRFWDCSGLHALVACTRDLRNDGRSCRIVGALPATRRLIAAARLTDELAIDGALTVPPAPLPEVRERTGTPGRRPVGGHPLRSRANPSPVSAGRPG